MAAIDQEIPLNILLADDDIDDCIFFKGVLEKIPLLTCLTAVHNGEELMRQLTKEAYELPHVLFLDLNMPRKNGFECLSEIKLNPKLKHLPVVMFSTSHEQEVVSRLYRNGAQYFIRKPPVISQFEKIIQQTLILIGQNNLFQPAREDFVLVA